MTVNSNNSFICFDLFLPHVAVCCLLTVGKIYIYLSKDIWSHVGTLRRQNNQIFLCVEQSWLWETNEIKRRKLKRVLSPSASLPRRYSIHHHNLKGSHESAIVTSAPTVPCIEIWGLIVEGGESLWEPLILICCFVNDFLHWNSCVFAQKHT